MNEMAVTADHLIVIGRGRLIADCPTGEFVARWSPQRASLEDAFMQLTHGSVEYDRAGR